MEKICRTCGKRKSLNDFWKHPTNRDRRQSDCKECAYVKQRKNLQKRLESDPDYSRKRQREWEHRGRNRLRARLKKCYGITLEQYDSLMAEQDNKCGVCRNEFLDGQRIAVDHDHSTGEVRGILHIHCNSAIGFLGESPAYCRFAAEYLEKHRFRLKDFSGLGRMTSIHV